MGVQMDGVLGIVKTLWNILNKGSIGGRERYMEKELDLDQYYAIRKTYDLISFDGDYRYFPKCVLAQAPLNGDVLRLINLSKRQKIIVEGAKKEHIDQLEEILPKLSPKLVSGARIVFLDRKVFNQKAKKLRLYNPQDIKAFAHHGSLFLPSEDPINEGEFVHQLCEVYRFNYLKPPDKEAKERLFKKYKLGAKMQNSFAVQGGSVWRQPCATQGICIDYGIVNNMVSVDIPEEALGGEAIITRFQRKRSSHSKHDRWDLKEMGWAKGRTLRIPLEDFENPVYNFANVLGIKKTSMDKVYEAFRDYPAQDVISKGGELFYNWWRADRKVATTSESGRFKQLLLKKIGLLKDEGLITHERYEQIAKYKWHKQKSKTEPPRYTPSSYTDFDFCNVIYLAYQYPQYLGWLLREADE